MFPCHFFYFFFSFLDIKHFKELIIVLIINALKMFRGRLKYTVTLILTVSITVSTVSDCKKRKKAVMTQITKTCSRAGMFHSINSYSLVARTMIYNAFWYDVTFNTS